MPASEAKVKVERLWPNFKGNVQITGLNLPPGFDMATADVPAGTTDVVVKLTVAGNVPPGTYGVVVRGDAQVPQRLGHHRLVPRLGREVKCLLQERNGGAVVPPDDLVEAAGPEQGLGLTALFQ